ncbi:heme peroxidase [Xylariales sp. PMI_506]|nr:heme peroxidase [Xylariales sp. PMI_506]
MSNSSAILYLASIATASAVGYCCSRCYSPRAPAARSAKFKPTKEDYQKVYDEIAGRLEEDYDYDDGSFGPILVRLAWHASGTWDAKTRTGGSNGATMRFHPESGHGANAGLNIAREFLEPVKVKFPWITYADLWILAGVAAIQEMQGPAIPFRPGRQDTSDAQLCPPDGRLPDASQGSSHLRDVFYRMGLSDQEIVALSGAHGLGRCHEDRLGFEGAWTYSPTVLTNHYYDMLLGEKWVIRDWEGPRQFQGASSKLLMMLPTDMALVQDEALRPWVERYAADKALFFDHFAAVVTKLFEFGVPFPGGTESWTFKPTNVV